eukprot:3761558-Rhodomonas_salina.1
MQVVDPAQLVRWHVAPQRPEHHIRDRLGQQRHHLQRPVRWALRRQCQPALEGPEHGRGDVSAPPDVPRVEIRQLAPQNARVHLRQQRVTTRVLRHPTVDHPH